MMCEHKWTMRTDTKRVWGWDFEENAKMNVGSVIDVCEKCNEERWRTIHLNDEVTAIVWEADE